MFFIQGIIYHRKRLNFAICKVYLNWPDLYPNNNYDVYVLVYFCLINCRFFYNFLLITSTVVVTVNKNRRAQGFDLNVGVALKGLR